MSEFWGLEGIEGQRSADLGNVGDEQGQYRSLEKSSDSSPKISELKPMTDRPTA